MWVVEKFYALKYTFRYIKYKLKIKERFAELAQLVRAFALQARGRRFESVIPHQRETVRRKYLREYGTIPE